MEDWQTKLVELLAQHKAVPLTFETCCYCFYSQFVKYPIILKVKEFEIEGKKYEGVCVFICELCKDSFNGAQLSKSVRRLLDEFDYKIHVIGDTEDDRK